MNIDYLVVVLLLICLVSIIIFKNTPTYEEEKKIYIYQHTQNHVEQIIHNGEFLLRNDKTYRLELFEDDKKIANIFLGDKTSVSTIKDIKIKK